MNKTLAAIALLLATCMVASSEPIALDTPVRVFKGGAMVPAQPICQWLNAEVKQDDAGQTLTAQYGELTLELRAGEHQALVNGEPMPLDERSGMEDTAVENHGGYLFVPLIFIGQALGLEVSWDTTCGGFATIARDGEQADTKVTATMARYPLHWAAAQGETEIAAALMDSGLDVNSLTYAEWTPLHWAAREGHTETVKLLLDRGAQVDAQCKTGWTPLHWAVLYGRSPTVELLLERGAQVNLGDEDGELPLHYAARRGHIDIVEMLLDRGADVNGATLVGITALHNAAAYGRTEVAQLLIQRGAQVNARTRTGITPLYWAERQYREETAATLREHDAER